MWSTQKGSNIVSAGSYSKGFQKSYWPVYNKTKNWDNRGFTIFKGIQTNNYVNFIWKTML